MNLGFAIKQARQAKRLTQKQLAEQMGVRPITIQQYESGKRQPKLEVVQRLSAVLGVKISYLLGEEEEQYMENSRSLDIVVDIISYIRDKWQQEGDIECKLSPVTKEIHFDGIQTLTFDGYELVIEVKEL